MLRIGVIGFGYWGPNLVRNFSQLEASEVHAVADRDPERLALARTRFPWLDLRGDAEDLIHDKDIDCIVVATPVGTHYPLARAALEAGKHVLIEKPMTATREHAEELIDLAQRHGLRLMVDHTFLYTGAVRKMKQVITEGQIGEVDYFDSVRVNLGLFQHDINVVWDLAPHDVSIFQYLVDERPHSVIATGVSHTSNQIENLAYITLRFQSNRIAHFTSSWISPVKIRKILIGGSKKMLVYDDLEPTEKVKLYDTAYSVESKEDERKFLVDYRVGDIFVPKLDNTEALALMAQDFCDAVEHGKEPISNWQGGLEVVRILEAAHASLRDSSREIVIG